MNLEVGDFCLHANTYRRQVSKLHVVWRGPYRVTKTVNNWVYEIEDLLTSAKFVAHALRLRYYSDKHLDLDECLMNSLKVQAQHELYIDKVISHRRDEANFLYQLEVQWLGFNTVETTWEPLQNLVRDASAAIEVYILTLAPAEAAVLTQAFNAYRG